MLKRGGTRGSWWSVAVLAGGACLGAGCGNGTSGSGGSGGGGGGGGGGGDFSPPQVVVQFPFSSTALTDAPTLALTIAATDASSVTEVRVAGTPATNALGLWKATVPLPIGARILNVQAEDSRGNTNSSAATLTVQRQAELWIEPAAITFDTGRGEALVLDIATRSLIGVDPVTGLRRLRSNSQTGTGPTLVDPRDIQFVDALDAVAVTDQAAVLLVNLGTGARTTLSSPSVGSGDPPGDLFGVALDGPRNRLLVLDAQRAELTAVDLSSGARTAISSATVGTGPSLAQARRIALDLVRNRALVSLAGSNELLSVNLATGARATFVTAGVPALVSPADLIVNVNRDELLIADPSAQTLFRVTLATGARSTLSGPGGTIPWNHPVGVTLHLGSVPLVVDSELDAVFLVGADNGVRLALS